MNLLFDLDGTLTNSSPGIVNCIRYALEKLGLDPDEHGNLERYIGPPLLSTFHELLGNAADAALGVQYYRERFSTIGLYENAVYAGIEESLATLAAGGHRMLVATSKPTIFAAKIVSHFHLDRYFEQVYGSDLDGSRSDKSELIAHLLEREQLDANSTLMIGDRSHDIAGARSNNLRVIGVLWGFGSNTELVEAGADMLCESPAQLANCVT